MISRAVDDGVPRGLVLADQGYGGAEFRDGVRALDLQYAVAVDPRSMVMTFSKSGRRSESRVHLEQLARQIDKRGGFRRCTRRQGTKKPLSARFAPRRVVWAGRSYPVTDVESREPVWLLIEWRDGETEPRNYFFCSLPGPMTTKRLVRVVTQRWRTERVYEDLKGELGLDHYEGRRFPGWHHHVSVVLACTAFVVAERTRAFPPRPEGRWPTVRNRSRPERHFADSFITVRLAIARTIGALATTMSNVSCHFQWPTRPPASVIRL